MPRSIHLLCGAGGDGRVCSTYEVTGKVALTQQAGNAVTVSVARWIGERLMPVLT